MKYSIIKKVKTGLKMAAVALIGAATVAAGAVVYANYEYSDYASNATINNIAELIDCDKSNLITINGEYVRMEHNGDEPIYVCIDDEYTETERTAVEKSLNNFFGIIGKINSKYRYKIIKKDEFDSIKNKTKIYYTLKNDNYIVDKALGEMRIETSLLSLLTN